MEERLFDAAYEGNVIAFTQLLKDKPKLMDRTYLDCESKNVLHISAMLGHVEFVKAILLVNSCNSYRMCLARDRDGKNPLHLATINGKLNILELVTDHIWLMQAAQENADEGGTILHLCIKYNQFESLKTLLRIFTRPEFVSALNDDGMTILHLAMHYNHHKSRREIIIHLIENTPEIINIKNADGKTILDLFLVLAKVKPNQFARLKRDHRLLQRLEGTGGIAAYLLRSKAMASDGKTISNHLRNGLDESKDAIMIVASVTATMAFQVMVSPPGGVWQEDSTDPSKPHQAGQSVLAQTHPEHYDWMLLCNTISFASSASAILTLLFIRLVKRSWFMLSLLLIYMVQSVLTITATYALSLVTIDVESEANGTVTIVLTVMMSFLILSLIVEFIQEMLRWEISELSLIWGRQKVYEALILANQSI